MGVFRTLDLKITICLKNGPEKHPPVAKCHTFGREEKNEEEKKERKWGEKEGPGRELGVRAGAGAREAQGALGALRTEGGRGVPPQGKGGTVSSDPFQQKSQESPQIDVLRI